MKRLIIGLTVLLALTMSVGALAALNTNITGWMELELRYKSDDPDDNDKPLYLGARARARAQLSMSAGSSGNPKVTITMQGADTGDMKDNNWIDFENALERKGKSIPFEITGMYLDAKGAYWKNGPVLDTRIGTLNRNWNQYTAHQLGRNGIWIRGLSVGPVKMEAIYAYTQSASNYNKVAGYTGAIQATGKLDPVDFEVYVTNVGADQTDSDSRYTNYTVVAGAKPVNGLQLDGVYSIDSEHEGTAYKVEAKLTSIDNLTLTGEVRFTDDKYSPKHTEARTDHRVWWSDEQVYRIDAETVQSGVKLGAGVELKDKYSVDQLDTIIRANASTNLEGFDLGVDVEYTSHHDDTNSNETVLTVGTKLANVDVQYKGTIETVRNVEKDMINEIEAKTKINTLIADNMNLAGKVVLEGDEDIKYGVIADWRLPNGLDVQAGYANFGYSYQYSDEDWDINGENGKDGFFIRAHRRISF